MDVRIEADHVRYLRYDFPTATVHPTGTVTPAQIRDADRKAAPPEIRTVLGETLFIPWAQGAELELFARRHAIATRHRPDIWGDLLEPFLDTGFTPEHEQATQDRLTRAGFPPAEVTKIRRRVAPIMLSFNGKVWDWYGLGLYDLLLAATGPLVEPHLQAALGDPAAFYHWAMHIADRPATQPWVP